MILINEPTLQIAYLAIGLIVSLYVLIKANKRIAWLVAGVIGLTTIASDSLYIIPSFFNLTFNNEALDMISFFNLGSSVISITSTVLFVLFYWFFKLKFNKHNTVLIDISVIALAVARILFALFPSNEWFTNDGFLSGLTRNVPVIFLGLILIFVTVIWARQEKERAVKYTAFVAQVTTIAALSCIVLNFKSALPLVVVLIVLAVLTISIWLFSHKAIQKLE